MKTYVVITRHCLVTMSVHSSVSSSCSSSVTPFKPKARAARPASGRCRYRMTILCVLSEAIKADPWPMLTTRAIINNISGEEVCGLIARAYSSTFRLRTSISYKHGYRPSTQPNIQPLAALVCLKPRNPSKASQLDPS